ncbi:sigma-70 family RNA polymerase sigma factor [Ensifer soli]|uniref:sigma-70 family RNA polymerase sigma factor n=1 Tax=Ciceribacter sp. sgz301302 TaxID=3342379 RepID=UPI0035BAFF1B
MEQKDRPFDVIGQLASLRRYARSLVRSPDDAEDLVHDALVKAYERRSTFREGGSVRTWLFSILHNTHVDRLRKRLADRRRDDDAAEALAGAAIEAGQDHAVRLAQVREAFYALPEEQRVALHLVAIEDLSYQEAADALGIPVGTLMSRISRARQRLRSIEDGAAMAPRLKIVGGTQHDTE